MNDFLPSYLDTIDERLLGYLDENDELRADTVQRLRFYTSALLDGSLSPAAVVEDWPDWFDLAPAFVAAYAPGGAEELEEAAFPEGPEVGDAAPLTKAGWVYLRALEVPLDMYPEMRPTEE